MICVLLTKHLIGRHLNFQEVSIAKSSIFLSLLLGGSLITTALPLCMELAVEICYPIPEIVVTCWITFWFALQRKSKY